MTNLIGQSLGRYRILEQLGEGGMATVYKAYDTRLERKVAIKVIRNNQFAPVVLERMLKRFEREARALARLSHPNIVKILDYGEYQGAPYLVMEFLPGGTFKQRVGKPIPWQEALRMITPVAQALAYAHENKIIHRDIKPSNILVAQSGEPMLSDFGIARILEDEATTDLTASGAGVGTPEYMAPEQGLGQSDERSDIYSLGVVLYQIVTAHIPFRADTPMAIMIKKNQEPVPRPRQFIPSLPASFENLLLKLLARTPANRHQSMREVIAAFGHLLRDETIAAPSNRPSASGRSWMWIAGGAGMIVLFTCLVVGLVMGANLLRGGLVIYPTPSTPIRFAIVPPTQTVTFSPTPPLTIVSLPTTAVPPIVPPTITWTVPPPVTFTPSLVIGREQVSPKDGMTIVFVPGGDFLMGSESGEDNEKPVHTISVGNFWMDQTEVTNQMYSLCIQDGKCKWPEKKKSYTRNNYFGNSQFDNYPVIHVSWNDATAYCTWAGRRLPTEAEWEKAASWDAAKGEKHVYPWGNSIDCSFANYAGQKGGCVGDTTQAGSYPSGASFYGLLDMAGNVWEWVNDFYTAYPGNTISDPFYGNKIYHIIRGGSWYREDYLARSVYRLRYSNIVTADSVGFRCATSVP